MHISHPTIIERMRQLERQAQALCVQRDEIYPHSKPLTIIAVSKRQSKEKIRELLLAGHKHFGENTIQEAETKWHELKEEFPDVKLHFIGSLQSNKIDKALALFDFIHSLDRPKLARGLKQKQEAGIKVPKLFIQVNTGAEKQKGGIALEEADNFIQQTLKDNLPLIGLMCLPPADENPAPHFALLREVAQRNNLPELSMGMSSSLEAAILSGATYIRPGKIIWQC